VPPAAAAPAPAGRCDQDTLNHPALTGMDPADLTALAAALEVPFAARREQRLYQHRGGPRRGTGNTSGHHRKLDLTDHVLATRMRQHLNLPPQVIGALLGAGGTTVSHATSRIAPLLAARPPRPAAPAPGIRLRTLDDLRDYAAAAGISLAIPAQPPDHAKAAGRNPDTPKLKTDATLTTTMEHRRGCPGTAAARRPGPAGPAGPERPARSPVQPAGAARTSRLAPSPRKSRTHMASPAVPASAYRNPAIGPVNHPPGVTALLIVRRRLVVVALRGWRGPKGEEKP
jgi:hypothetical protein